MEKFDLAKHAPTRAQLESWIPADAPVEQYLNRRSPAYRELGLDQQTLTRREAIDWMMKDVNLIRRPVLLVNGRAHFGFSESDYATLIGPG